MKNSNYFLIVMTLFFANSTVFAIQPDIQHKANEIGQEKSVSGTRNEVSSSTDTELGNNSTDIQNDSDDMELEGEIGKEMAIPTGKVLADAKIPENTIRTDVYNINCKPNTTFIRASIKTNRLTVPTDMSLTLAKVDNSASKTTTPGDTAFGSPARLDTGAGDYRIIITKTTPSGIVRYTMRYGCHKPGGADVPGTTLTNPQDE